MYLISVKFMTKNFEAFRDYIRKIEKRKLAFVEMSKRTGKLNKSALAVQDAKLQASWQLAKIILSEKEFIELVKLMD